MTKVLLVLHLLSFIPIRLNRCTKISGIFYFEYQSPYCLIFLRHMERISPLVGQLDLMAQRILSAQLRVIRFILLSTPNGVVPISPRYHKAELFIYTPFSDYRSLSILLNYSRVTIFTDCYSLNYDKHTHSYRRDVIHSGGQACNSQSKLINSEYLKHPLHPLSS